MDGCGNVRKTRGRPRKYGPMLDPTPQKKRGRPRLADVETTATDLWELSPNTLRGNEELPLSVHTVLSDDDLLSKILVRLPVVSLVLFKFVSKRWLSLIKDAAFIMRRSRTPIIDPPSGLCIERDWKNNVYDFVPFDNRIRPRLEITTFKTEYVNATVLQSCNGLFLCSVNDEKICVYNPTLNLFKVLPEPLYHKLKHNFTRMDFDPTKSLHYKVVYATRIGGFYPPHSYRIQTYSSETGIWSIVCICSDPFEDLEDGIYWNDALHWITRDYNSNKFMHYKLDFVNKTVVLTKIQLPIIVDDNCKLFESRGCLLLIGEDKTHSHQLNVYEMRNGHSEWSIKYSVNDSRISLGEVWCIALGEREEDSFMVLGDLRNFVLYKFMTKTFHGNPEWQLVLPRGIYLAHDSFMFTASFASV